MIQSVDANEGIGLSSPLALEPRGVSHFCDSRMNVKCMQVGLHLLHTPTPYTAHQRHSLTKAHHAGPFVRREQFDAPHVQVQHEFARAVPFSSCSGMRTFRVDQIADCNSRAQMLFIFLSSRPHRQVPSETHLSCQSVTGA